MDKNQQYPWIIGISGASGTIYGRRLIQVLSLSFPNQQLEVVISEAAFRVMREEERIKISERNPSPKQLIDCEASNIRFHTNSDIGASIASGSYKSAGMVIAPCSMATLSAVAHGYSHNLMHRAADVCMKEGRKLIIVPRETPLSQIHLENMLSLSRLGVSITAAMPGFYHQPVGILDIVDMLVMKILDQMGFDLELVTRWTSQSQPSNTVLRCV